tara:strand:- start:298 stop:1020 length:723 start_codon:yes stop_codon:yes gene_type:complete
MNRFSDQGIVLSVRPHGEGGAVVHLLTQNHGKCGGYVNGAQSSGRLRSLLQPGNIVSCEWQAKSEGALGRYDLELEKDVSAVIFDDPNAIHAVQSACSLIDMFLPEREIYFDLYQGTEAFLDIIKTSQWPAVYILWEVAFLKEMGYGIDLSKCAVTDETKNLTHVSPKTGRAVCEREAEPYKSKLLEIPHFMQGEAFQEGDIETGLALTGHFMIHRLLQHSTFQAMPEPRIQLEKTFQKE